MSICSHDFLPFALRRNFSRNVKRWLVLLFLATITGLTQQLISPVGAQQASGWDGTWSGAWGGRAETSVQIAHGRVVRYEYQGATVPIATQKVTGRTLTFGIPGDYTITIDLTSPGRASANYESSTRGSAQADLTRQEGAPATNQPSQAKEKAPPASASANSSSPVIAIDYDAGSCPNWWCSIS